MTNTSAPPGAGQPTESNSLARPICLLLAGIIIGIAAMAIASQMTRRQSEEPVQVAEKTPATQTQSTDSQARSVSNFGAPNLPPVETQNLQQNNQAPGHFIPPGRDIEYGQTISGYPIYTGRKAVDSEQSATTGSGAPYVVDQFGSDATANEQPVGRNGLRGNPCVDPPSTFGTAYGRNKW